MELREYLSRHYYENVAADLRLMSRLSGNDLSYNSIMYLDVISYQHSEGGCTVGSLARTLAVSLPAVTAKVNGLVALGLVQKEKRDADRRVTYLSPSPLVEKVFSSYDRPFERAAVRVERDFSAEEIETFCRVLNAFTDTYTEEIK